MLIEKQFTVTENNIQIPQVCERSDEHCRPSRDSPLFHVSRPTACNHWRLFGECKITKFKYHRCIFCRVFLVWFLWKSYILSPFQMVPLTIDMIFGVKEVNAIPMQGGVGRSEAKYESQMRRIAQIFRIMRILRWIKWNLFPWGRLHMIENNQIYGW